LSYRPTAEEFEKPTPQLLSWLENSLSYYQQQGNEKAIGVFRDLLAEAKSRVTIITRSASEPQPKSGFRAMLDSAFSASSHNNEEEAIQRASDDAKYRRQSRRMNEAGFRAMLEAARPSRAIEKPEPEIRGGYGFLAMLDASSRGNAEMRDLSAHRDSMRSIPWGFVAMLESMSPHRTPATLDEKPHIRRGMGFGAMLEAARRGT